MENVSIQKAGQLPASVKSAVEQLLGRSIAPEEEISIVAVPPQQVPPVEDRAQVARKLEALLNRRAEKVNDVPEDVIDAAIDQAVDEVRRRRS
jgi:hypothetical protein